jgi:hypothetical protein
MRMKDDFDDSVRLVPQTIKSETPPILITQAYRCRLSTVTWAKNNDISVLSTLRVWRLRTLSKPFPLGRLWRLLRLLPEIIFYFVI